MQIQLAGLPWFAADDYESFRDLLPNRAWHRTHAEWQAAAEQTQKQLETRGVRTVKAHVRAAEFRAWCQARGLSVDTQALLAFANEFAAGTYFGEQSH